MTLTTLFDEQCMILDVRRRLRPRYGQTRPVPGWWHEKCNNFDDGLCTRILCPESRLGP